MIKCCIFDLDGTLLNTLPTIRYYVNETMAKEGYSGITEEQCRAFVGNGARRLIERSLLTVGVTNPDEIDRVTKIYKTAYDAAPRYLTEVYDGIREMICELKRRGILLAVCSNKPSFAAREVCREFFGDAFSAVCGAEDGVPLKPDPTSPLALVESLGISPRECAFIGDTGVDICTGKNMGAAQTVGVLWGFRERDELEASGASVIVSHPREITSALFDS